MSLLHITKDNFNESIQDGVTIVDFWADWCMPCKSLLPTIDELATELEGKAAVGKVNIDEEKALAVKYHVMSIPTVLFFQNGEEKERLVGAFPKQKYLDTLAAL